MQPHGSKYFARRPLPDPGDGVNGSKFNFFRTWSCFISNLKGSTKCNSMVANILPTEPSLTLGMGSICQKSTFSEQFHVAYQIKGNHECSNMVANILPADRPTPDPLVGSKGQILTLSENCHITYQIKLNHQMQAAW